MDKNFNTHIKRGVSVAVLAMFCVNFVLNPAWAQTDLDRASYDVPVSPPAYGQFAVLDSGTFTIPAHLGDIKYAHKGASRKIVVHLQDAHCNYFAQRKISDIIDYLNKEYGLSIINLEGGVGKYDLTVFTSITGQSIRREVADYFVKRGEINGAEFYAVNNSDKIQLWGVENKDLYLDNLQVYRDSLKYKPEVDECLKSLTHILNNLKRHIYTPELLKIDMAYGAYKAGNMDFRAYLEFLTLRAKEEGVNVREFANLYLLVQAMEQEEKVNFKKANMERNILIDELKNSLSKNEVTELVSKSVDFKTKKISRKVFYDYLLSKAKELGIKINRFPELTNYITYVTIYEAVNRFQVMKELDELETAIKEPLYRNDTERRLNTLSRNLALMKNIFDISLTKTDYEYYLANKSSFDAINYTSFIEKEAPIYKIAARPPPSVLRLDDYRKRIAKFYEYSFERDKVFIENLKFHPERENVESAVLMTGGFHTENICDLLKEKDISYVSIIPKFTIEKGYECPYFDLLAGQTTNIQRMLSSILAKTSTLQVASPLSSLGKDVWGKSGLDVFEAEVYLEEQKVRGKNIVKVEEDGDDIVFHLDNGTRERMPRRTFLDAVHQAAIDAQMERLSKEYFEDVPNIDEITNDLKTFLQSIGANQKVLAEVESLKGNNADGRALVRFVLADITFRGHAGGQGIRIKGDIKGDDEATKAVILHEIIAGLFGDHFLAQKVEDAFLTNTTSEQVLSKITPFETAIWFMAPEAKLTVDRDFIEDVKVEAPVISLELKNAERIAEEAYEKAVTTGVEGAVPEKYGLNKAMREVASGESVVIVTAETSSMRLLNNKYGHTAVDFVRDKFGEASFGYLEGHKKDLEDAGVDFISYYNPYGGRWQYVFTKREGYNESKFKEFLNALLDEALRAGREEAESQGFEKEDVLRVVIGVSTPTPAGDITKTQAYSNVRQKIILNKLYETRRVKTQIPADIARWLRMKINSPPGIIITELEEHKEFFGITSTDEFDKKVDALARDEYYKSLIGDASYQTRDLIVFAENKLKIKDLEGKERIFFADDASRKWIQEAKANGTTTRLFDYFGFPQYIPNYSKIEIELGELKKSIASNPRGEELKVLLQKMEDFTQEVLILQYETAYGTLMGSDVINTATKEFSERLKENGRGVIFRINADFDKLSHAPIKEGDVIKMRGALIIKEEFEKVFEGKGESAVLTVQKGAGDELVVTGYFDGEKRALKELLENVFGEIETKVQNITYDGKPLTYVVVTKTEKYTKTPSVSGGVSFVESSIGTAEMPKGVEFLDAKAEAAAQYSKDTGRARFSFYEDIKDKYEDIQEEPFKLHPEKLTPILEKDLWDRLFVEEIPEYQKKYFSFFNEFSEKKRWIDVRERMFLAGISGGLSIANREWTKKLNEIRKKEGVYLANGYGGQNLSRICKGNFDMAIIINDNPFVAEVFMPIRNAFISMAESRAEYLALISGVKFNRRELDELKDETLENIRFALNEKIKSTDSKMVAENKSDVWNRVKAQLPKKIHTLGKQLWTEYEKSSFSMNFMLNGMEEGDSWLASEDNFNGIKTMIDEGRILGITGNWGSQDLGEKLSAELSKLNLKVSVLDVESVWWKLQKIGKSEKLSPSAMPVAEELSLIISHPSNGKTMIENLSGEAFYKEAPGILPGEVVETLPELSREEVLSRVKKMTIEELERLVAETPEAERMEMLYETASLELEGRRAKELLSVVRPVTPYAILMPLTEDQMILEKSKYQNIASSTSRILEKKYGTNVKVFYYVRGDAESLNAVREKAMKTKEFSQNDQSRLLAYVTTDMAETDIENFRKAEKVAGVVKEELEEEQRIDEVLHVVLGVGLIDYARTRRDDIADRVKNLLRVMVEDPASIKGMNLEDLLKGVLLVKIRKIDYGEIDDWKEAQDAILRAL